MSRFVPFLFCVFIITGCRLNTSGQYNYVSPEYLNDGLEVGTLWEVGMDSTHISKSIKKVQGGHYNELHTVLIHKNGKLVLEEYFAGHQYQWDAPGHHGAFLKWDMDRPHNIMSVTKSITATLVGLAIDNGFIGNVHQSIFDFLPEHQHLKTGGKAEITIQHLLTMTSGLHWYEWNAPYSSVENPIIGIWYSEKDPISFILEGTLIHEPGTHFSYFGGNHILLGEIIRNASNMPIDELARKYLFEPLGIKNVDWPIQFKNGVYESAGTLLMRPRDMLKIGVVYLNDGTWNGKTIISSKWVKMSRTVFKNNTGIRVPGEDSNDIGYSYSWWLDEFQSPYGTTDTFHASGWGGQKIVVVPEFEMVVVFTGGNYSNKLGQFEILEKYILRSLK